MCIAGVCGLAGGGAGEQGAPPCRLRSVTRMALQEGSYISGGVERRLHGICTSR